MGRHAAARPSILIAEMVHANTTNGVGMVSATTVKRVQTVQMTVEESA